MSWDSIESLREQLCAVQDAVNWGDSALAEVLKRLPPQPRLRLVVGVILKQATGVFLSMSQSTTINLTNCANPAAATFFRGLIDFSRMSAWERIKRLALPSYRWRCDAESLAALNELCRNPDAPCVVDGYFIPNGWGDGYS